MYLSKGFTLILIFSFAFLIGAFYLVGNHAYLTATFDQANQTRQQIETERPTVTAQSIFVNNLRVSISLFVPAIGIVPFAIVWSNTAVLVGLLAKAYGISPATYVLYLTVLAFPEMAAYTFALAENLYVTILALSKTGAKERIVTNSWKSFIIYFFLLIVGAITEASML